MKLHNAQCQNIPMVEMLAHYPATELNLGDTDGNTALILGKIILKLFEHRIVLIL